MVVVVVVVVLEGWCGWIRGVVVEWRWRVMAVVVLLFEDSGSPF